MEWMVWFCKGKEGEQVARHVQCFAMIPHRASFGYAPYMDVLSERKRCCLKGCSRLLTSVACVTLLGCGKGGFEMCCVGRGGFEPTEVTEVTQH